MPAKYFPPKNVSGGPRRMKFVISTAVQEGWHGRPPEWNGELLPFAVKFSRVFARKGKDNLALYHAPSGAVFICRRFKSTAGNEKWTVGAALFYQAVLQKPGNLGLCLSKYLVPTEVK